MKRNKLGRRAKTKVSQLRRFDSIAEQQTAINEFLNTVPGRMKPYSDTVTFNMDETPCYFDMSNAHTIEFKGAKTVEIMVLVRQNAALLLSSVFVWMEKSLTLWLFSKD